MLWISLTTALLVAVAGLLFGSFLNVCISRLPRGESVVRPGSHCRSCGRPVAWYDNVPLLSWVWLGGRCRRCHAAIPWRYLFVESITCTLFLLCWLKDGLGLEAALAALFCFLLLGLAVMDAETMLLPDSFTVTGIAAGVAAAAAQTDSAREAAAAAGWSLLHASIAAAILLLILGGYWLIRRRAGMGLGDVKLLAMLAAWLGLAGAALAFFLAVVAGAVYGIVLLARSGQPGTRRGQIALPFGAFLSAAGIYSLFLGERTVQWYLQFFR